MSEIRQRWRLIFARGEDARYLSHLDAVRAWERAFRRGQIPVATSEGFSPRPKLVFAAPLQLGLLAERELADLYLSERLTSPDLRARLAAGMPRGYRIVDLHDVWVGTPALAPQLAAADYRLTLFNVEHVELEAAIERLMAAPKLARIRLRERKSIAYDLRPLLLDLRVHEPDPEATPTGQAGGAAPRGLWLRLRHSQNGGSGRPEEVVGALADELGMTTRPSPVDDADRDQDSAPEAAGTASDAAGTAPDGTRFLESVRAVRERLWLADELEADAQAAQPK
jgi:radical SAM-linked protein